MAWFLFEANSLFLICVACVKTIFRVNVREHPDLNRRPFDLQSNPLPLRHVPTFHKNKSPSRFFETHVGWAKELVTETRRNMSCSMDSWCSADESSITYICSFRCENGAFILICSEKFAFCVPDMCGKTFFYGKDREHPDLNWRPLDLQSNALPLSYVPKTRYYKPPSLFYLCTCSLTKESFTQISWSIWFSEDSWWSAVESSKIHLRFCSCSQKPWFLIMAQVAFDMWAWVEKASFAVNDGVYAELNRRPLHLHSNAL